MLKLLLFITALLIFTSCKEHGRLSHEVASKLNQDSIKAKQDSIIEKYLKQGAWKHHYYSKKWNFYIDEGLKQDSTIAYLWQQKAMPFFKQRKYEVGLLYLDQAVKYDTFWLDYRGFIKCIFGKTYKDALVDFEECKKRKNNGYIMDHSYDFYMALCYLQLNEFQTALSILKSNIDKTEKEKGKDWIHHLDLFYLGVIYYELGDYDKAIAAFDRSIAKYSNFSDAKFYKGQCIGLKGDSVKGVDLIKEAKKDFQEGSTINEDNSLYELYPYQVNWKMVHF
ncbi:MAG TPA: tetratricopeptide repeat protein [Chitinophagaceae bacterium]|nr:tetratricopeptide repeat protein [Chitinophagaceae bacterium]